MRIFLLFILILVSKFLSACGFYPYGEDIRISLFNPSAFDFYQYSEFNYSSNTFFNNSNKYPSSYIEPNTKLWFDYCRGNVDISSVQSAVYELTKVEINEYSQNAMIKYFYLQKDHDALNYLRFAKNCEFFNSWQDDPWERQTYFDLPKRTYLMNKAINLSAKVQNQDLKKRYTFLAIRLAWYNHHYDKVKSFFASTFEKTTKKDILYYWSLYFKSLTEKDSAQANFELAQVFSNALDKRFVCYQHYNKDVSVTSTLQFAKTKEEKANVYLLNGIGRFDKTLPYLQKIYELNPASDGLSFLLLREINKIEDFVFTPYYTLFQPSILYDYWGKKNEDNSVQQTLNRAEHDRIYAQEVLQFINAVNLNKVDNPFFWQICKAYLQFITRRYNSSLDLISKLEKASPNKAMAKQLQIIKALVLTAKQKKGNAIIPTKIQSILFANQKNGQFIFAIGKELENLGNTTDAALLYSKLTKIEYEGNFEYIKNYVYWKTSKKRGKNCFNYYTDYYDCLDAVYTPEQTQILIENINENKNKKDTFSVFKYEIFKEQVQELYDLLGTKFIRQNKLTQALFAFEKAGSKYWNRAYTMWESNTNTLEQNPFYALQYTPQFIETEDTIRLNKYTITKQLIKYLHKAEDKKEKNRDYYYFLVANAYFNMGHEGNAYIMRRISGWSANQLSDIEDEAEFRQSNLAKHYYLLAKKYARKEKFQALCLRMVIRCEKHKIEYMHIGNRRDNKYMSLLDSDKYYLDLKANYPDYFDDLVSSCDYFKAYFEARR